MNIWLEILTVLFVFLYIYKAANKKSEAWIYGCFASIFSAIYFYIEKLYFSHYLNIIYFILGVAGYINWRKISFQKSFDFHISIKNHFIIILFFFTVSFLFYNINLNETFQKLSFKIDFILALLSIIATVLEIKKDSSCWIYWIFANIFYCLFYVNEHEFLYSSIMFVYAFLSVWALTKWRKRQEI